MRAVNLNLIVARNVRRIRLRRGMSQEQLAEECGLHRTYIGAIERGERNITLATLSRVALALQVDPQDLLEEQGNVDGENAAKVCEVRKRPGNK
jgi:transcriptional regulator with XRE-family HTH domain